MRDSTKFAANYFKTEPIITRIATNIAPKLKLAQKDSPLGTKIRKTPPGQSCRVELRGQRTNWGRPSQNASINRKILRPIRRPYLCEVICRCGTQPGMSDGGKTLRDKRHVTDPWRNWKRMSSLRKRQLWFRMLWIAQHWEIVWRHLSNSSESSWNDYRKMQICSWRHLWNWSGSFRNDYR